ncbi:MAG: prolipoprotein diacylglyceryl transferase [Spirochaetes bacterium GWF1_51_8]|nr:MAG: prolipoprotein diacylglyceryl transferase [Spirochaetes bacterium GWF1_51_8]
MFSFLQQPNINPVIFAITDTFAIRWYSMMYVVGFLLAYLFFKYYIKKGVLKVKIEEMGDVLFVVILGVLVGGRLGYILFYNLGYYLQNPLEMLMVWKGGMSFHGGFIFSILAVAIYLNNKKKSFIDYADLFMIPLPLGLFFGRWGNFVNGELWGNATDAPWGMLFGPKPEIGNPGPSLYSVSEPWVTAMAKKVGIDILPGQTMVNLPRHPSQIYEMLMEGAILFTIVFLVFRLVKNKPRGLIFAIFTTGYGLARFIAENFRQPDAQLGYLAGDWLTMGMVLSLPMVLLGIAGIILSLKLNHRNELWGS